MTNRQTRRPNSITSTTLVSAALAVLLSACGAEPASQGPASGGSAIMGYAGGGRLLGDPVATHEERLALVASASRAITLGADLWGADPATVLDGWVVVYGGYAYPCPVADEGRWPADGCYGREEPVLRVNTSAAPAGCRMAALVHELGHLVIGDAAHLDPRWAEVPALMAQVCPAP